MEIPAEIAPFGDSKLGNFSQWGWGWRRKFLERGLGMGMVFYHPSRGDSVPENY
jgi:hypothetical protein